MTSGIKWIAWHPYEDRLICLSGNQNLVGMSATLLGRNSVDKGHYKLFSVTLSDGNAVTLYNNTDFDVRGVGPALSPDGRFVVFISKIPRYLNGRLFIAATDGSGWTQLINDRSEARSPAWRLMGSR